MAFPDLEATLAMLGHRATDKITGAEGIVTSVCFDLYGCVQVTLHSGLDKEGKPKEQFYYDVNRINITSEIRVMDPPLPGKARPTAHPHGPAEKPKTRSV